ncbi:MAG: hypothetical protein L7H00_05290 [Vulcanisaeta sp.]|nr:hypothetical protein [Vulcanisaeta sp.]
MTNESRYIRYYPDWSMQAFSAYSSANSEVDAIETWVERYKRCLGSSLYPAVVCAKVRETLENKVKSAKETVGWIEAVIKDAERVWVYSEHELEGLMRWLDALVRVKEKLQRAVETATKILMDGAAQSSRGGSA